MCGRFYSDEDENERILNLYSKAREKFPDAQLKSGEIFPGDTVPVIGEGAQICVSKWGLENPYRKNAFIINSRSETANEKFKEYFKNNRIVIPCSGYYEWNGKKEKYYFGLESGELLFMCGISTGPQSGGRFSVLTKEAALDLKTIHDRMPLMLEEKNVRRFTDDYDFAKYVLNKGLENVIYSKC